MSHLHHACSCRQLYTILMQSSGEEPSPHLLQLTPAAYRLRCILVSTLVAAAISSVQFRMQLSEMSYLHCGCAVSSVYRFDVCRFESVSGM